MTQNLGFPAMFKPYLPKGFHNAALVTAGIQYQLDLFGKNRASFERRCPRRKRRRPTRPRPVCKSLPASRRLMPC